MRNAFAKELKNLTEKRDDIVLLSGDIGNRMFDDFKQVSPSRFINCGIAEANMMSVASGLGLSGFKPVVYTITPFTTTRCLEQIKIGACYHQSPVTIVGTGSGLSYAELGPTHHSFEDISVVRSLPNIRVLVPSDSDELIAQLRESIEGNCPTYIRIGKKGEPSLKMDKNNLGIAKGNILLEGKDIAIISSGPIISEALKASDIIRQENINVGVINLGSIKPLDEGLLKQTVAQYNTVLVLEEHSIVGGIGSAILEFLEIHDLLQNVRIKRLGIPDNFIHKLGGQEWTRESIGIDYKGIIKAVYSILS